MSILLSYEQSEKAMCTNCSMRNDLCDLAADAPCEPWTQASTHLAKAAAIHAVQYLEEPCTEHGTYLFHFKPQPLHSHRFDCTDCMKQIHEELGI